jgi:hypothetical protein
MLGTRPRGLARVLVIHSIHRPLPATDRPRKASCEWALARPSLPTTQHVDVICTRSMAPEVESRVSGTVSMVWTRGADLWAVL